MHWGARTLDLDLIAYGRTGSTTEVVSDDPDLTLPHPRAHTRAFVLVPWARAEPARACGCRTARSPTSPTLAERAPDRAGVREVAGWASW